MTPDVLQLRQQTQAVQGDLWRPHPCDKITGLLMDSHAIHGNLRTTEVFPAYTPTKHEQVGSNIYVC